VTSAGSRSLLAAALLLGGCCFAPTPSAAPAPVATTPVVGARGPGMPGCVAIATAIVGSWAREGFLEEYRADGTYLLNGRAGTYRWLRPGHAVLEIPEMGWSAEYDLGLRDARTLLAIDPSRIGTLYDRRSEAPAMPDACFDLTTSIVGTWLGGPMPETYRADLTYQVAGAGTYSFPQHGVLRLVRDDGLASDYSLAMVTPDTMMAIPSPPLEPRGIVYTRQP
jgi:hypothetical protein